MRIVPATYGVQDVPPDPPEDLALAEQLRRDRTRDELIALASEHGHRDTAADARMRRVVWRAMTRSFGQGVRIGRGVLVTHPETFEIGDGSFIGDQAILQGRYDGRCVLGKHVWIGPQAFLDARDLIVEDYVGWGPGARVLGSEHTGTPSHVPIIQTDLRISPVRVGAWSDIGVNSVLMPGVTIGKGAIVGAGAVVTGDVEPFSIVVGVPARFLKWREGHEGVESGRG